MRNCTMFFVFSMSVLVAAGCLRPAYASNAATTDQPDVIAKEELFPSSRADAVQASTTEVSNGDKGMANVHVVSWRDMPFQTVKHQALDYSCGSAAVATLLTYVYGVQTNEEDVFKAMFAAGDQAKIRREGFSLLDMSNYLNQKGFKAVGYKINYSTIEKEKVPFIALINNEGYNHFVVVKSLRAGSILVGDPNKGNVIYTRQAFVRMWNGVALIVTNNANKARSEFANAKEWGFARVAARIENSNLPGVGDTIHAPALNTQMAPTGLDVLSPLLNSGSLSSVSVQTQ